MAYGVSNIENNSESVPLVFISHSSKENSRDKIVAHAVCGELEANGIKCWIAPRDIMAGDEWDDAIVDAIEKCILMIVIFSERVNESDWVKEEIHMAYDEKKDILTFRIEDAFPKKGLKLRLSRKQWFDAVTEPMNLHIQKLVKVVNGILEMKNENLELQDFDTPKYSDIKEDSSINSQIYKEPQVVSKSNNEEILLKEKSCQLYEGWDTSYLGGMLKITNQRICFKLNFLNTDKLKISMENIVEVKKSKTLGFINNAVEVKTMNGDKYKFAFAIWEKEDIDKIINLIKEYAKISK